jgi:hypothetical protein
VLRRRRLRRGPTSPAISADIVCIGTATQILKWYENRQPR